MSFWTTVPYPSCGMGMLFGEWNFPFASSVYAYYPFSSIKHVPPAALSTDSVPLPVTRKRKRRISTSSESSSSSSSNSSSSDPSSSSDHSSLSTSTDSDSDSDSNTDEPEPPCQSVDKRAVLTAKSQDLQKRYDYILDIFVAHVDSPAFHLSPQVTVSPPPAIATFADDGNV